MELIKADMKQKQRVFEADGAPVSTLRLFVVDGTGANIVFRLSNWLAMRSITKPLALICQALNKWFNGCVIGVNATFDEGLVLMHPMGVVINSKVRGGKNIVIESGVVIGDEKGHSPVLGNNIFIGAGAKIIGNVTIGDNVKIGANAVVVKDLPANCTGLGIPAKPRMPS
ncbi:serine O-acetyltransferase [Aestuariibacter sp. A3R04]|uniref:serine O-acetyltransferase n=1 Tax=Aestuariibacter sp. A3R04 TaxID=2841571 RepID=UPI001C0A05D8|nr:serine acetyltransferase [Aestuariibacter sp. A3R04]MBU3021760.1 serine acetyltransferase [Aestuariibacter sp. A3R04]